MPSGKGIDGAGDKRSVFKESGNKADNGLLSKCRERRAYLMEGAAGRVGRQGADMKDKKRKQRLRLASARGLKDSLSGVGHFHIPEFQPQIHPSSVTR